MNPELQYAQDLLAAMQAQRDLAMNGLVYAQAEIMGLKRQLAERENEQSNNSQTET